MFELTAKSGEPAISKGANLLGLSLSYSELNELQSGNHISLENRSLSEIGSLFIMVSALADINADKTRTNITFGDLPKPTTDSQCCPGIPIYCWESNSQKMCLFLAIVDGKPVIRSGRHS
ncbi:MAG: hypothetical protein AAF757_09830 [Cyanobacteria bacterium P01_D01_bin.116]